MVSNSTSIGDSVRTNDMGARIHLEEELGELLCALGIELCSAVIRHKRHAAPTGLEKRREGILVLLLLVELRRKSDHLLSLHSELWRSAPERSARGQHPRP
jgi:hypothetical protein